jgi:signal transduction histidine kinase
MRGAGSLFPVGTSPPERESSPPVSHEAGTPPVPILLLAPPEAPVRATVERMEGVHPRFLEDWDTGAIDGRPGGVVLLDPSLPASTILQVLVDLAGSKGEWGCVLVRSGEDGGLQGFPLSPEPPGALEAVLIAEAQGNGLRSLSQAVARARHDINNPLTSALAEVQLLLMDHPDDGAPGEVRESLLLVQGQLRRIRDLVRELSRFRTPSQG